MPAQLVSDAWRGWSANHDHVGEIFAEFIDNALALRISNAALPDEIKITWDFDANIDPNNAIVTISDQLGGMVNPIAAWTVGNQQNQVGPLNEHGYGFKHSIAAANPENNAWWFWTRTDQNITNDEFHYYQAPYDWNTDPRIVDQNNLQGTENWPGDQGSGTVFRFNCSIAKFKGIRSALGIGGVPPGDPSSYVMNLEAYLGFLYGPALDNGDISIVITPNQPYADENGAMRHRCRVRDACYPANHDHYQIQVGNNWQAIQGNSQWSFDGVHQIPYEYEAIRVLSPPAIDWRKPFYQRNAKNAGLEIRLNGRVLAYGLFDSSIFSVAPHPLFNAFVFRINLLADQNNKQYIPSTKTTKSGMQITDELLELFACVQNHCPNMDIFKTATENTTETVMTDHLQTILEGAATQQNPIVVQREYGVWDSTRLDIHSTQQGQQVITAYECKKGRANALDLYQLRMYCDGLHDQGNPANVGILVANQYAPDVVQIMQNLNNNNYHTTLELHTWQTLTGVQIAPYGDANPVVGP